MGGGFFLLPFFVNPLTTNFDQMLEPPKLMAAFLLGNLILAGCLWKKSHPVIGLIHGAFAVSLVATKFGSVQIYPFIYWSSSLFIAYWFFKQKEETRIFILNAMVLSGFVLSIYAIFQFFKLDPIFRYAPVIDRTLPIATMGQTTKFGAYIAVIASIALAIRNYPAFVLCFIAAILTRSSFTVAALAAGILVNLRYFNLKRLIVGAAIVAPAAITYLYFAHPDFGFFQDHGRFHVWRVTLDAWWNGPYFMGTAPENGKMVTLMSREFQPLIFLFGYGAGAFGVLFHQIYQPKDLNAGAYLQSHNDFVQVPFDFGLLGVGVLFITILVLIHRYRNHWWIEGDRSLSLRASFAGLAALLVNACGNFPFQLAPHFVFGIMFLTVILTHNRSKIYV